MTNRTSVVGLVVTGFCVAAIAAYADPQPAQPSSFQDWGLLAGVGVAAGAAAGAWRVVGRIEGRVERWAERLQDHSDTLEAHQLILVTLPKSLAEMGRSIQELKVAIESRSESG